MPWENQAHVLQLLSLCCRAWELQLLSPCGTTAEPKCPGARALQTGHRNEKPAPHTERGAHAATKI